MGWGTVLYRSKDSTNSIRVLKEKATKEKDFATIKIPYLLKTFPVVGYNLEIPLAISKMSMIM